MQAWTDRHLVKTVERRGWIRVQEPCTERLRSTRREAPWCLADNSQSTRLPVIHGYTAKYLPWEHTGAHPRLGS